MRKSFLQFSFKSFFLQIIRNRKASNLKSFTLQFHEFFLFKNQETSKIFLYLKVFIPNSKKSITISGKDFFGLSNLKSFLHTSVSRVFSFSYLDKRFLKVKCKFSHTLFCNELARSHKRGRLNNNRQEHPICNVTHMLLENCFLLLTSSMTSVDEFWGQGSTGSRVFFRLSTLENVKNHLNLSKYCNRKYEFRETLFSKMILISELDRFTNYRKYNFL